MMAWLKLLVTLTFTVVIETKYDLSFDDVTAIVGEKFDYQLGDEEFQSAYKIVRISERGEKTLPKWLHFDANFSMLIGYPQADDAGMYTLRLKAQCIDPLSATCQDKLSRTFSISVVEPLKSAESRGRLRFSKHGQKHGRNDYLVYTNKKNAAPDAAPVLKNSIDHIKVLVGRYFELRIPSSTFEDQEDGNTRNLSLTITLVYGKPLPADGWLKFNEISQTLYGIPLKSDTIGQNVVNKFILTAKDSQGQVVKDAISLTYEYEMELNHRLSVKLNGSYEKFTGDRANLIQFARNVAGFYGDKNLDLLTFSNIEKGSVIVTWSNNSLLGMVCKKSVIQDLYDKLIVDNETLVDTFTALFSDYTPLSVSLEFSGVCLLPPTSSPPLTKSPVTDSDDKLWIEIILPALIAILVIVIIALLLLICCRHRRPSKNMKDSDKPAFLEDRRPIIFPEELEMVDSSLKPKTPLVLPADYLRETPPAVPLHSRPAPEYLSPELDDSMFPQEDGAPPPPPPHRRGQGQGHNSDPPPYRLPPPYFNPHRST